jgi:translation elongation factor EF-4
VEPLPGYATAVPMVFCGMFPTDADQYDLLRESLDKLKLNDASLSYTPEANTAMGFGFRVGFLGLLHLDIVQVCLFCFFFFIYSSLLKFKNLFFFLLYLLHLLFLPFMR